MHAQPSPPPPVQNDEQVGIDKKDSKKARKTGRVRLWNFCYAKDGIAVFLGSVGEQPPPFDKRIWIARGSKSPERRSWLDLPNGDYEVFAISDDAVPGNMGTKVGPNALPSKSLLQMRQGIKIEGGSFQTIVLYQKDGKTSAQLLNDGGVSSSQPLLRIFTFQTAIKPTVSMLSGGSGKVVLAENVGTDGANVPIPQANGPVTLEIAYPVRPDFISRQNVELDFTGHKSSSIIISPDRYGDIATEFTTDAPLSDATTE